LIFPAIERLLELQPGELVLDCACGNGSFSRRMARAGAKVVAFDFSAKFLDRAKSRTVELADRIEYRLVDPTDEDQLRQLGKGRFDAAVCNMALMDMVVIEPLIAGLSQLLKANGRFVFSVLHPCFNNPAGCKMVIEEEDRAGELVANYAVKVSKYIQPSPAKGRGSGLAMVDGGQTTTVGPYPMPDLDEFDAEARGILAAA
jgi:2-polyprenyl-3-methyl-5-hydroxy-6-metoxy-1,4-benzoquinol methylase